MNETRRNERLNERSSGLSNNSNGLVRFGFRLLLCVIAKDAAKASKPVRFSITTLLTFLLVKVATPL